MSSQLFTPITIGSMALKNRIVIPPMCQYSANEGLLSPWHTIHYGGFACSSAGMLIVEATGVQPEGRITPFCPGIWTDEQGQKHAEMLKAVRPYASMPIGIQLAHSGRKGSTRPMWIRGGMVPPEEGGWIPVAPSPLPFNKGETLPHALSEAEIAQTVKAFGQAAQRAHEAGYDFIELHAAHGYLLHQFLSPVSNKRDDSYGGSLENRMRFALEAFKAIRDAFPAEKPVGVRISATDWIEGGWDVESSRALLLELEKLGCAYAHISSGGLAPEQQIAPGPSYQVNLAAQLKDSLSIPTITVGLITSPEQAEGIIVSGQADMVAIGRGMLFDPRWPWRAAMQLGASVEGPPQYWRGAPYLGKNLFIQPD